MNFSGFIPSSVIASQEKDDTNADTQSGQDVAEEPMAQETKSEEK